MIWRRDSLLRGETPSHWPWATIGGREQWVRDISHRQAGLGVCRCCAVLSKSSHESVLLSRFDPAQKSARGLLHPCTRARASAGTCRRPPSISISRRAWRSGSSKRFGIRSGTRRSSATCGYSSTRRKRGRRAGWPTGQGCTPTSQHAALHRPQYDWSPVGTGRHGEHLHAARRFIVHNMIGHLLAGHQRRHQSRIRDAITPSRRHSDSGTLAILIWKLLLIWRRNSYNPSLTCLKRKPISCR